MPKPLKVLELLDAKEIEALEAFARERLRSYDEVHEWLQAHGFVLSRTATGNWLREFTSRERFTASNDVARALMATAKEGGVAAISDAANLQLGQMIFEKLTQMQVEGEVETDDLCNLGKAIGNVARSKQLIEELKDRQKLAIEEASKLAQTGSNASAVVDKVREILGVA